MSKGGRVPPSEILLSFLFLDIPYAQQVECSRAKELNNMNKKILWIVPHPPADEESDRQLLNILNGCKHADTQFDMAYVGDDKKGPQHLEYHFYEDLVLPAMLNKIKDADKEGYNASIIGCFYDLGLKSARDVSEDMVVIGPAESSMNIACTYGHRFSILVGRKKWIPQMENNVVKYGYKERLASFRKVDLGVLDFHQDEERTAEIITNEARSAVDYDSAEVIILGCTRQFGFYRTLQEELGVPVIDTVIAPFKYAEFLAELKNRFGWKHSEVNGYGSPPREEIFKWDLEKEYF